MFTFSGPARRERGAKRLQTKQQEIFMVGYIHSYFTYVFQRKQRQDPRKRKPKLLVKSGLSALFLDGPNIDDLIFICVL